MAEKYLGTSYPTAAKAVQQLEELGMLSETTGQRRNRAYRYDQYIALFSRQAISISEDGTPPAETESVASTRP